MALLYIWSVIQLETSLETVGCLAPGSLGAQHACILKVNVADQKSSEMWRTPHEIGG